MVILATFLLLAMTAFIIAGSILMTYNLTPESQLVTQYNSAATTWTGTVRNRFQALVFEAYIGAAKPASLIPDTSSDPVPPQAGIQPYTPLKDISGQQTIIDGSIRYTSDMTTSFTLKGSAGGSQSIDIPLFKTFQQDITGSSPQMQCDDLNGHFIVQSNKCQTYWALKGVCLVFDSLNNKIARVGTGNGCEPGISRSPGSPPTGPYPGQWAPGIYQKLDRAPISTGRLEPNNLQPTTTGSYMVRELSDPYVRYQELSAGTLDFSNLKTTHKILGTVFLGLSAIPAFFLLVVAGFGAGALIALIVRNNVRQKRQIGEDSPGRGLLHDGSGGDGEMMDEPEGGQGKNPLEYGQKK
jgi:hypothetical protein